jgi:hypothetical protein
LITVRILLGAAFWTFDRAGNVACRRRQRERSGHRAGLDLFYRGPSAHGGNAFFNDFIDGLRGDDGRPGEEDGDKRETSSSH